MGYDEFDADVPDFLHEGFQEHSLPVGSSWHVPYGATLSHAVGNSQFFSQIFYTHLPNQWPSTCRGLAPSLRAGTILPGARSLGADQRPTSPGAGCWAHTVYYGLQGTVVTEEAGRQRLRSRLVCHICQKTYARRETLKVHMRIHNGEKPFRCPYCNRAFTQSGNMKVHMRIHTGEKPHQCDKCGKSFTQSSTLKAHQRNMHS